MSAPPFSKELSKQIIFCALALLLGLLLPLITHGLLPTLGIDVISHLFTNESIQKIVFLGFGAFAYFLYFRFATNNPLYLVIFSIVFCRFFLYIGFIIEKSGRHVPLKAILAPLLLFPAFYLLFKYLPKLLKTYTYFKYVLLFLVVYLLYYIFFNLNFVDPIIAKLSGASISQAQVMDYLYNVGMLVTTGAMFIRAETDEKRRQLFTLINRFVIVGMLVEGTLTIIGYPFGVFTMVVEGFRRATGFLFHPNEYAKIVGPMLIYFIGLYYYYMKYSKKWDPFIHVLLPITIVLNLLGFLLSLSKNSFLGFGVAIGIYFLSILFDANLRKRLIGPLCAVAVLLIIAFVGYQAFSGKNLLTLLSDRFSDTRSLQWRNYVWGYLLSNLNANNILFGHGLTASNMEIYRYMYHADMESEKQSIYIHNAFIQFIFDMGLCGLLIFGGIISTTVSAARRFLTEHYNPLYLTVLGLSAFVLVSVMADECITKMQMNMLYWFMVTMIFSFLASNKPQAGTAPETP